MGSCWSKCCPNCCRTCCLEWWPKCCWTCCCSAGSTEETEQETLIEPVPGAPHTRYQKWYHDGITDSVAERRLNAVIPEGSRRSRGTYLVYDNPSPSGDCMFVLLVYKDKMHKCKIRHSDGKFFVGSNPRAHSTVKALIKYHRGLFGKPIQLEEGGQVVLRDFASM